MMRWAMLLLIGVWCSAGTAAEVTKCRQQNADGTKVEICLVQPGPFQHDLYTLRADGALIFVLVDDFAEQIELVHVIPEGPALEFPLSRNNGKAVTIKGGCVPESKDGAEVARLCNFFWGSRQVVKDVRFEF